MISIDIYPDGWDKRYCLKFFDSDMIHFYGDRTEPGGNDYLLYSDPRVQGHTVTGPDDLIHQLSAFL
jgi:phosphomannomutase